MKIRNRNAISAIRKKFEKLEEYKKLNKKGQKFNQLAEAKDILRELQMETLAIERELTELFEVNSGISLVDKNKEVAFAKLESDPNFKKVDDSGGFQYLFNNVTLRKNGEDVLIGDILYTYNGHHTFYNSNVRYKNGVSCQHPHIYAGKACFGDYTRIINALESRGNFDEMISVIKTFLFSYNSNSVFLSLDNWNDKFTYLDCGCLEGECECDDYGEEEEEEYEEGEPL